MFLVTLTCIVGIIGKQLDLVFTVPSLLRRAYKRKSTEYVEELIGHEGEGSLFASLKSRGLAERISAGVAAGGLADTTCCALFTVTIKLTDEGFSKVDDVISSFFQYVEMMRRTGPQEWSWREAKDLRGIEFRFKEEEGAAGVTGGGGRGHAEGPPADEEEATRPVSVPKSPAAA